MDFISGAVNYLKSFLGYEPSFNEIDLDEPLEEETVIIQEGLVTKIQNDLVLINDNINISLKKCDNEVKVGDLVTYKIDSSLENPTVSGVKRLTVGREKRNGNSTFIGKVKGRNGRLFTMQQSSIKFDLDQVKTKFLPVEGDWLELFGSEEEDEIIVKEIKPLRYKVLFGTVTSYYGEHGVINRYIYFTLNNCDLGYQPRCYDKVTCCIIESDQGTYAWRAIQVIPKKKVITYEKQLQESESLNSNDNFKSSVVIEDIEIHIGNDEMMEFAVSAKNHTDSNLELMKINFYPDDNMVKYIKENDKFPPLLSLGTININFVAEGLSFGYKVYTIEWIFDSIKCQSKLILDVGMKNFEFSQSFSKDNVKLVNFLSEVNDFMDAPKPQVVMPGRRLIKPCSFVPVQLGSYIIPAKLKTVIMQSKVLHTDWHNRHIYLKNELPILKHSLRPDTYVEKMHTLLFLEEIAKLEQVASLKMQTSFLSKGEFLVIETPEGDKYLNLLLPGDRVLASVPWETTDKKVIFEGFIHNITLSEIYISFHDHFHNSFNLRNIYEISFEASRTLFRRQHQAVDVCWKNLGEDWLFPSQLNLQKPQLEIIGESTEDFEVPKSAELYRIPWCEQGSGYGRRIKNKVVNPVFKYEKRTISWCNKNLNELQKRVVKNVLEGVTRPLPYVVFGPPGTGKTITIVEIILQLASMLPSSRILVAAPSNSAVDIIALRLLEFGVKESDIIRMCSYSYMLKGCLPVGLTNISSVVAYEKVDEWPTGRGGGIPRCDRELVGRKKITLGTLGCLGFLYNLGFPKGHFSHVVIDEAGQANEPEFLVPTAFINKNGGQIIIAGDPMQLGPVISGYAIHLGLQQSFLKRISAKFPYIADKSSFPDNCGFDPRLITKLTHNYRSLPGILGIYNHLFYDDELVPTVSNSGCEEAELLERIKSILPAGNKDCYPVVFHNVDGNEEQSEGSTSYFNKYEAMQVCSYLSLLYDMGLTSEDIGIISPYLSQVKAIRSLVDAMMLDIPKTGTVEEYQGQERSVIIISTVRSLEYCNDLAFIANNERMNVAISRAKSLLIVIGKEQLLSRLHSWKYLIDETKKHSSYIGRSSGLTK